MESNLVFTVQVSTQGPIFEAINDEFLAHCSKFKILHVTPNPSNNNGSIVKTPNAMPWVLSGPKGRPGNRNWVEDPKCLTAFTFTLSALRASPYSNTPNYIDAGVFIFIGIYPSLWEGCISLVY